MTPKKIEELRMLLEEYLEWLKENEPYATTTIYHVERTLEEL